MKLINISVSTSTTANVERRFSVLTLLSTKLRNTLAPNSLDKLMQLISMEPHIYDLDSEEITNCDKFLKKLHSVVLIWSNLNYSLLKILKSKIYFSSLSLFLVTFFCVNATWWQDFATFNIRVFSLPFFPNLNSQIFVVSFSEKSPELIKTTSFCKIAKLSSEETLLQI